MTAPATAPPSASPSTPDPRRVLPFVILTVFLDLVGFGIILPVLPLYVKTMSGSPEVVGILFASFAATQLIATPILGRASDRYGRRRVIVLSLAGNVLSMVVFALAATKHALPLLFASRLIAGATAGNLGACQATVADVCTGPERVKGMGKIGAGISLGVMLGPFIGGKASMLGEAGPPLVAAALAAVALVGVLVFLPETNANRGADATKRGPRPSLSSVLEDRRIIAVLVLYFLTFLYMSNLQVSLPLMADARFGWKGDELGNVFGLFGMVMLIVQWGLIGQLSKRFASHSLVMAGSLSSAVGLGIIASAHAPIPLVVGLVLFALGLGTTNPLLASIASDCAGKQQGVILGFAQSSGGLARAVGPLLWGLLYGRIGAAAAFLGGALAAVLACSVAFASRSFKARVADANEDAGAGASS